MNSSESACGYGEYFGLAEPPFSRGPSDGFLFESTSYVAAAAELVHALAGQEPIVVVTGAMGTGKTTLCQTLARHLDRRTVVASVRAPLHDMGELLRQVLNRFGVLGNGTSNALQASHDQLVNAFSRFVTSLPSLRMRAVIVIDDAQGVDTDLLRQIRSLVNLHADAHNRPLRIILVGSPGLDLLMAREAEEALGVSASHRRQLRALNDDEVSTYVNLRLKVARHDKIPNRLPVFTESAMTTIGRLSAGLPGVVNSICDGALNSAWRDETRTIDDARVVRAARLLRIEPESKGRVRITSVELRRAVGVMLILAVGIATWTMRDGFPVSWRTALSITRPSSASSTPTASVPSIVNVRRWTLAELMERSAAFGEQPDVKALQQLREEVIRRQDAGAGVDGEKLKAALDQVEKDLENARRRQLEEDGQQLTTSEK